MMCSSPKISFSILYPSKAHSGHSNALLEHMKSAHRDMPKMTTDATPVSRPTSHGHNVGTIPQIQLPDETPCLSGTNSRVGAPDGEARGGSFLSKDGDINCSGHNDTEVE